MTTSDATQRVRLSAPVWIRLSIAAAALAFAGSIVSLADVRIYERLSASFVSQALAQDIANLVIAPLMLASAVLALRGSLRAYLVWLGVVAFTLYSYVIYVFSVPFGPLFPVWAAVLGLSLFSLIGGLRDLDAQEVARRFRSPRMVRISAWLLLVVAGLFALLWLSEDVPALLAGSTPQSVVDMAIPTNPVHILDYVFFLPAGFITGIGLLRRNHFSFVSAPALLVLLALTCVPILITPFVQEPVAGSIGMVTAIGLLAVTLLTVLVLLLRSVRAQADRPNAPVEPDHA